MSVNGNGGPKVNYEPNSLGGPAARQEYNSPSFKVLRIVTKYKINLKLMIDYRFGSKI